jgi:hypothetical protein
MNVAIHPSEPEKLVLGMIFAVTSHLVGFSPTIVLAQSDGVVKHVNCDAGQSLAEAVKHSKEGQTLRVRGICRERVPITTPRLTLAGAGTAVIDGTDVALGADPEFDGLVVIDGVTGVTLSGLTIQNSAGNGILAQRGAAFAIRDLRLQNHAFTGIAVVDHSAAELTNTATIGNRLGLDVVTSSSAVLKGTFSSSHNGNGVDINGTSIVELRGAQVELNENGGYGLIAASGSHVAIFGWQSAAGSTVTANGNGSAGLIFGQGTLTTYVPSVITASNNTLGLLVNDSNIIAPFGTARFRLDNNTIGMSVGLGTNILIRGGLSVQGNGTGVLADAAGTLTLSSIVDNPSTITGNGTDMRLLFGTRSTIEGVTIGTLVCDSTVLSRGTKICP